MATEIPRYPLGPCPECHLGTLWPGTAFYCTQVGELLITAPDFPAWICDVCGRREYDDASLQELEALLEMKRGQRAHRRRAARSGQQARSAARQVAARKRG